MAELGRILLADDEELFLHSTADLLRRQGYECDCAVDARTAVEMLGKKSYDLLIADIKMPGNPDLEFIKELPRIAEGMPAILVTGYPSLNSAIQSIQLPVVSYLIKPFEFSDLLAQVMSAITDNGLLRERHLERALKRIANDLEEVGIVTEARVSTLGHDILKELSNLSDREWEILRLLRANQRVGAIARSLHIDPNTVRSHLKSIFQKMEVHSQTELLERLGSITMKH